MIEGPQLHDYGSSRAVLIGTWEYRYLQPVPAARNSLQRMEDLLTGPLCGWPQDRLQIVRNEAGPGDLPDRLITAFEEIDDVALFYYVGHGQIDSEDQLCLGLVGTRTEANRRAATSLKFSDIRAALQASNAAIKIVILDCCFAGLAAKSSLGGFSGNVLDMTAGTGAYTMAATSAYTTAWYEDDPEAVRPQTFFTKYLVDLVEQGIPGQPAGLRLDPLYKRLHDNLGADERPLPVKRTVNDARDFLFAWNAAPPETQRDPEREVILLNQRLAEYDAQIRKLQAEAEEHASELEDLREQASTARQLTPEEERQLQIAIGTAERRLDDTREAEAAARAARAGSPVPSVIGIAERAPPPRSHYQRGHLGRSARFRILVGLLVIICTAGVVTYISLPDSSASNAGSSGPAYGGTLHLVADDGPDHLDTVPAYYTEDYILERAYTRQLVSYPTLPAATTSGAEWNETTTPAADVAEQVPTVANGGITDDGDVYTFHIKPGVKWNTTPSRQITAYDFIREFKAFCNPVSSVGNPTYYEDTIAGLTSYCDAETTYFANSDANPPTASNIAKFQNSHDISGIQATDSLTLKFTLIQPVNDFLYLLALPFASARPVEYDSYVPDSQQLDQHTISDGPYQISSYQPGKSVTLVRNPAWKQSTDPFRHDYVDSVAVTVGVAPQAQLSDLESETDDLQMVGTTTLSEILSSIPALTGSQALSFTIWPWPSLWPYLAFNLQSPDSGGAVKKLLVRQAIEYGLDKLTVLEAVGGPGLGSIANSATVPGSVGYEAYNLYPDNDGNGDVSTCRTDLAKAGYPHGLTLTYMYANDPTNTSVFAAVQSSLASCGITLTAKAASSVTFFTDLSDAPASDKPGAWDIGQSVWIPDWYGDDGRTTIQSLFQGPDCVQDTVNYSCYDNATVNSLIDRAEAATSVTQAAADWHAADVQIMKDAVIVPMVSQAFPLYSSKRVRSVLPDGKSYPTAIFSPNIGGPDITNTWLTSS
jgi:ABC-type transport system substrate-binding protein